MSEQFCTPTRPAGGFPRSPRSAFSFVEILFAVMILGIGFILIAGIFPVAINQTQYNGDETIAASTARAGAAVIASLPNTALYMAADATPTIHPFGANVTSNSANDVLLWQELNGAQVLTEDPRYAWVPFYSRGQDSYGLKSNTAQITIIVARVRNHAQYTLADQSNSSGTLVATRIAGVSLNANTSLLTPDQITFPTTAGQVAPGAFVVIATDYLALQAGATNPPTATGTAVGWILKVGAPTATRGTYFLQPGGDIKNQIVYRPPVGDTFDVYVVGQGADPDSPSTFSGGAQDVMAYTTFIPLH